jgi:hypothetical protein
MVLYIKGGILKRDTNIQKINMSILVVSVVIKAHLNGRYVERSFIKLKFN